MTPGTGLHDDVAAGAGDDVEVRTNLDDVETGVRLRTAVGRLLTRDRARAPASEDSHGRKRVQNL